MKGLTKAQRALLQRLAQPGVAGGRCHWSTANVLVPRGLIVPQGPWADGWFAITDAGRAALQQSGGSE